MNKYDSIVVGGGRSGLLSALVLSKAGKKVLVLEKNNTLGNNCNSYMIGGYQVDTGPHAITQLRKGGPLMYLMDNYFDYVPVFLDYGEYFIRTEKGLKKVPADLSGYLTMDILQGKDRLIIAQALTKMMVMWQFGTDLSRISVYDCLPWDNLTSDTSEFVDTFCYFLSGRSMKETSVQRMFVGGGFVEESIQKDVEYEKNQYYNLHEEAKKVSYVSRLLNNRKVSYNQFYPRDGLKAIVNAILYSLPKTVEIKTNAPVEEIITEENTGTGVRTREDSYYADLIILPEKAAVSIDGFIADTKTPVKNLYIAGTDADDRSMGVTRAAYSVVKLIKILEEDGHLNTLKK